jgi:hypothetical protein
MYIIFVYTGQYPFLICQNLYKQLGADTGGHKRRDSPPFRKTNLVVSLYDHLASVVVVVRIADGARFVTA